MIKMVRILYGDRFLRSAGTLPKKQQEKLAKLLTILMKNPFHPLLHTKPLVGKLSGLFSFRITRDYRAIFKFLSPDEIHLLDIGHRKEIYR